MDREDIQLQYAVEIDAELEKLPIAFRSAVYHLAYENGHAYGMSEVLSEVQDLVYALLEPIRKYRHQIENELSA